MNSELATKLESYLSNRLSDKVSVTNMISLSGGACQDNYLIDLDLDSGKNYRLVFRTDKGASLYASLSRADEFSVCEMAHNAGVNTPKPYWLETDRSILGNPFYFLERIDGKASGRYIVKDPSLKDVRKTFAETLAKNLAKLHSIREKDCNDLDLLNRLKRHNDDKPNSIALQACADMREQMQKMIEPHPAMELILNWLEKNAPSSDASVLTHGDFRTGNFMVTKDGISGIIDWEFAHYGDRHEDFAWLCMRDWRFGKLKLEVGGFAERKEFMDAYSKYSDVPLDDSKTLYWEVMGNLRWAIGSVGQAERHISGADKGIELASIGRRASEMEWEAMRLIEASK
ncbi:MAG: phosphotransferase family protein [Leptospiraceae bacterium]|nr:phosphotransferase family protein [Leptospiraceae bacterium]